MELWVFIWETSCVSRGGWFLSWVVNSVSYNPVLIKRELRLGHSVRGSGALFLLRCCALVLGSSLVQQPLWGRSASNYAQRSSHALWRGQFLEALFAVMGVGGTWVSVPGEWIQMEAGGTRGAVSSHTQGAWKCDTKKKDSELGLRAPCHLTKLIVCIWSPPKNST